jgi:serine/threonine protein kinase
VAFGPGARIGVYEITAPIGEGGMGAVYRARDTRLDREVAIKILPDIFASDPERVARFTREAQTLASLNHPHIAQVHGFEESAGTRALIMELVNGEDLSARIARGSMPLDETLSVARQMADALDAAHEAGIVHRDLKPANVRITPDGIVKVLDFGLAKSIEATEPSGTNVITSLAMTLHGAILGTAAYMAPEQARGRPVDRRADLWALGCVVYEMLTGRRAFSGADITDTITSVLRDEPAPHTGFFQRV